MPGCRGDAARGKRHTPDVAEDMTAFDVSLSNMESWQGFCPACGGNAIAVANNVRMGDRVRINRDRFFQVVADHGYIVVSWQDS